MLETLGFEVVVSPDDSPLPWMLRAAAAEAKRKALAAGRPRRNTRRAAARQARLSANEVWRRVDVE